ncbi:MAG: right-handed parallel beta-helix repeat-containing protein [Desulfobacteraceae bacterium]|jgi:hypothetical protein
MRTNIHELKVLIFLIACCGLIGHTPLYGATYYVDYDQGSDTDSGTSESAAWQHAPGDPNATDNPQAVVLGAGDQVLFRGGVRYQGRIGIPGSGAGGTPLRYTGNGWGDDKAVIDGGQAFGGSWTPCASAAACGGNPNYAHIYHTDAPSGKTFQSGFFEDGDFIWASQEPNPGDRFHYDRTDGLRVIPIDDPSVSHTRTSITDPRHLTQSDPNYYDGAYVIVWHIPNVTTIHPITGFDPSTDTLTHEDLGQDVYDDRDTYYAVLNHLGFLDSPGEFVLDEAGGRFYLWPSNSDDPSGHTYTVCSDDTGIYSNAKHDLIIEGFNVRGHHMGIRALGTGTADVVIRDNEVTNLISNGWYAVQVSGDRMTVVDNRVENCLRAVGILAFGSHIDVSRNYVRRTSRQGIWFMEVEWGKIVDNTVVEMSGTHANGVSVYEHHEDVLIARNQILNCSNALTYHGNHQPDHVNNLVIYGNLVDGPTSSWGADMNGVKIFNNTFLGRMFMPEDDRDVTFINNIVHGGGLGDVRTHNLYTDLMWNQTAHYGWSPGEGEIVEYVAETGAYLPIDSVLVYEDAGVDHHLAATGPAVNSGTDISSRLPTAIFPEVDFTLDLAGNPRGQGGGWDMGAYEYNESGSEPDDSGSNGTGGSGSSGGCFLSTP